MGLSELVGYVQRLHPELQKVDLQDRRIVVALAAAGLTSAYAIYLLTRKRYNLPPGPRPWPIVGNLFSLEDASKRIYETLAGFTATYGDVFTIYLGSQPVVILNSPDAIREALLDKGNDYADRPTSFSVDLIIPDDSTPLIFANATPVWKLQRKIAHAALRKFASGIHLEQMLQRGSSDFIELVMAEGGKPFDPLKYLTLLVYNTVGTMVFGRTFELEDPWYIDFTDKVHKFDEIFTKGFLADVFPILGYLPNSSATLCKNLIKTFENFVQQVVKEHRENYDPNDISDFVYFLMEAEKQAKDDPSEDKCAARMLTDKHLLGVLTDIFFAGTDTSRLTLQWLIGFCVQYPQVQAKIHKEVDDVIGPNGVITLSDKNRLPYTAAVLFETLRLRPIGPMAIPHSTCCDTTLRDYTLPKGTQVWPNIWALHMDPTFWKDPERFDPDRWIDESGKKTRHPYQFLPFSTGRRVCVGESLAKVELHLYAAMILQKLEFRPPPAQEDSFKVNRVPGSTQIMAERFQVVATPRS